MASMGSNKGTPRKGTPRKAAPSRQAGRGSSGMGGQRMGAPSGSSRGQRAGGVKAPAAQAGPRRMSAPRPAPGRPSASASAGALARPRKGAQRPASSRPALKGPAPAARPMSAAAAPGASSRQAAATRASLRPVPQKAARPTSRKGSARQAAPRAASARSASSRGGGSRPSFLDRASGPAPAPKTRAKLAPKPKAAPSATSGKEARERHQRQGTVHLLGGIAVGFIALGLVALVAYFVLLNAPAFSVDDVQFEPTEHVSESDVSNLLSISSGTTLLNVDASQIEAQLKRDPWVASVSLERQFPHTLKITVNEQKADALVVMSTGSMGWYLGSEGTWIQPVKLTVGEGQSVNDAALAQARADGCLLITGVPATVEPAAGYVATDDVIAAVKAFREGFSEKFLSQIVSFDASSADAVSCVMESGVQVSLGSATNISYKEQVASALLQKYPGQLTYINVRVPATATVRKIGSSDVTQGSGAGSAATSSASGSASASGAEGSAGTASGGEGTSSSEGSGSAAGASGDGAASGGSAGDGSSAGAGSASGASSAEGSATGASGSGSSSAASADAQ